RTRRRRADRTGRSRRRRRAPAADRARRGRCRAGPASAAWRCTRSGRGAAAPAAAPAGSANPPPDDSHVLRRVGGVDRRTGATHTVDLDGRAVLPQAVEGVEVALVLVLDVHHDVDVVEQRPPSLAGALAADGLVAGLA